MGNLGERGDAMTRTHGKVLRIAALAMFLGSLGACATPPTDPAARAEFDRTNDPWEATNRRIFAFIRRSLTVRPCMAGMTSPPAMIRFLRALQSSEGSFASNRAASPAT